MNNKIKQEMAQVQADYRKGQQERAQAGLSAKRRNELIDIQDARVKRLKHLKQLLMQRYKFN